MKHTKGTWKIEDHQIGSGESHLGGFKTVICELNKHLSDEGKANAKLIAAAPELLEALIEIQKQFNKDGYMTGHLYEICETAIKKATA